MHDVPNLLFGIDVTTDAHSTSSDDLIPTYPSFLSCAELVNLKSKLLYHTLTVVANQLLNMQVTSSFGYCMRWVIFTLLFSLSLSVIDASFIPLDVRASVPDIVSADAFGPSAVTPAPQADLKSGVHPRIVFNAVQWSRLINQYASSYHVNGSWSSHQAYRSLIRGPKSDFIQRLASYDVSAYKGDVSDMSSWTSKKRQSLKTLADRIIDIDDIDSQALFMCAFWASVNERMNNTAKFLPRNTTTMCMNATVKWAKILLSHRAYNCASACASGRASHRANLWDVNQRFVVSSDSWTLGLSMALAYDVLYRMMSVSERRVIRSAIAMLVLQKESWGNTIESTANSPNGAIHPHRIFSNWAPYHSSLYLTNLAIEGETDFDVYVTAVLRKKGEGGFNKGLDYRFSKMLAAYMTHSIYPDGSTFEDGYTYFIAMLQGSLSLISATRRGENLVNTARFRNFIHNAIQITEPWHCGKLMGHGAGGGISFPTYVALFRYVYPKSRLTTMFWRNRMGNIYDDNAPCRIDWYQHMMQITILAQEHDVSVTTAISPQFLPKEERKKMPLFFYAPRRGLVIMRSSWKESSTMVHFDARPDAFIAGHDNADRGVFTFSSLRQTWLGDLPAWAHNVDSRKHSVMHVDGLAQGEFRTPSARMTKAVDNGAVAFASANLTYAYNVHWFQSPQGSPVRRDIAKYLSDGTETRQSVWFNDREQGDPRSFGWPEGDDGADIGMTRPEFNMFGDTDFAFNGIFMWKRDYRPRSQFLKQAFRSVALVRSDQKPGYLLVTDFFKSSDSGRHDFESYLVLDDGVYVREGASSCDGEKCTISLCAREGEAHMTLHAMTRPASPISYRTEKFVTEQEHTRIVVKAVAKQKVELWLGMHAQSPVTRSKFSMQEVGSAGIMEVKYNEKKTHFALDKTKYAMKRVSASSSDPMKPFMPRRKKGTTKIGSSHISDDVSSFIHETSMRYQVVVRIVTQPSRTVRAGRKQYEKLSTCTKLSKRVLSSTMAVYDCGDTPVENYKNRDCRAVYAKMKRSVCSAKGVLTAATLFFSTAVLKPSTTYFVAVSMDVARNKTNPIVGLLHRRVQRRS